MTQSQRKFASISPLQIFVAHRTTVPTSARRIFDVFSTGFPRIVFCEPFPLYKQRGITQGNRTHVLLVIVAPSIKVQNLGPIKIWMGGMGSLLLSQRSPVHELHRPIPPRSWGTRSASATSSPIAPPGARLPTETSSSQSRHQVITDY